MAYYSINLFCNFLEYSIVSLDNRVHVLTYSHNFTRRTLFVFMLVMATSFQNRRKNKPFGIKGTRILAPSNLLLTSSGVSSLDNLLGGGVAVGSIILIEEDVGHVYSDFLLKCFLAEGVMSEHTVYVSSLDSAAENIINDLPGVSNTASSQKPSNLNSDDLKIAWRYKDMHLEADNVCEYSHSFDMSKKMDEEKLLKSKTVMFDDKSLSLNIDSSSSFNASTPFQELLKDVSDCISSHKLSTKSEKRPDTILRLGIHSIGSPQWNFASNNSEFVLHLNRFFLSLKNIIRRSFSAAFITVPSHLFEDFSTIDGIAKECDAIFRLESLAATPLEKRDMWKEYSGLFHVVKLPKLNSMVNPDVDISDLAFKIKRRRFVVEKVHLPPMFAENDKEMKNNVIENSKSLYQTTSCSKLSVDF